MISSKSIDICKDFHLVENYKLAKEDKTKIWYLHHKKEEFYSAEELQELGMYYNVPPEDVVFVKRRGNEDRTCHFWWPHKAIGKHPNSSTKGKLWWTNGYANIRAFDCPGEGWYRGRYYPEESLASLRKYGSEKHWKKGTHKHSKESLVRISEAHLALHFHWYTNGINSIQVKEGDPIPEGYTKGRTLSDCSKQKISNTKLKYSGGLK